MAASATDAQEETPGAAVMLNDDNDNNNVYPDPAPAPHRPLEPVWDLEETELSPEEDDLMGITIVCQQCDPNGTVRLEVTGGSTTIRLWPRASKGPRSDIISVPKDFPINSLPQSVFVEGMKIGAAGLKLTYKPAGGSMVSDKVNIHVVSLIERQGSARRVINVYNSAIRYEVDGGTNQFRYSWDLNGDGDRTTDPFEINTDTKRTVQVSYGPAESASSVLLPRDHAHHRQTYNVSVQLTGGLILYRPVRVALDNFYGTPLMGVTVAQRQTEVAAIAASLNPSFSFDNTPPGNASVLFSQANHEATDGITLVINAGNRYQYAQLVTQNALTTHNAFQPGGAGDNRRVYVVEVGKLPYSTNQTREDVASTIRHENRHVVQQIAVRDNSPANNVWRQLDDFYAVANPAQPGAGYRNFMEAEGHLTELNDTAIGWYHLYPSPVQGDLEQFRRFYTDALGTVDDPRRINVATVRQAARQLLQSFYSSLPFLEMKREGYDFYVRPPQ